MIEIKKDLVKRWDVIEGRNNKFAPYNIDIPCTNEKCGRSLVNFSLKWVDDVDFAHSRVICASCQTNSRLFLIDTPATHNHTDIEKCRILIIPPLSFRDNFSDEIKALSPRFKEIYKQAAEAELSGFNELCGMGYRKALEFIVKDYLIELYPAKKEEILKFFLGDCIKKHVTNQSIKDCAERTAWLGNDETHYMRTWIDRDLNDLKALLEMTIHWIELDLKTKKYVGSMPKP